MLESAKCFEKINPDKSGNQLTRFQCTSCSYFSSREYDLKRHRRLIHGETANTTASDHVSTLSADASTQGSTHDDLTVVSNTSRPASPHERQSTRPPLDVELVGLDLGGNPVRDPSTSSATSKTDPTTSHQSVTPSTTNEDSGTIERFDSRLSVSSQTHTAKRNHLSPDLLSTNRKRLCTNLDFLSNPVDDFNAEETFENEADMMTKHDFKIERVSETVLVQDDQAKAFNLGHAIEELSLTTGSGWRTGAFYVGSLPQRRRAIPPIANPLANVDPPSLEKNRETVTFKKSTLSISRPRTLLSASETSNSPWGTRTDGMRASSMSASSTKRPGTFSTGVGTPQSISMSGASIGSLFGRPSTHVYKPWMTWSSASPPSASFKSLRTVGMPAPMLENVDEELLLSRAWSPQEKPRPPKSVQLEQQAQFFKAAEEGDVKRLRLLVEDLAFDCNHRGSYKRTPLIRAAGNGHRQAVQVLLSSCIGDINVNAQDIFGMTAIMFACQRGDINVVESLLSLRAIDLAVQDNMGRTALVTAISSASKLDREIIVQKLIAHVQRRPDYHTTAARWHPLFNAQDAEGLTPLHWAVKNTRFDCISTLLDTGRVDADRKALNGTTAAMQAVEDIFRQEELQLLLSRKACNARVTNDHGETLVGVARRAVIRRKSQLAYTSLSANDPLLQMAERNLEICEAYACDYAGQDRARELS